MAARMTEARARLIAKYAPWGRGHPASSSLIAFVVCASWSCTPAASPSSDLTPIAVGDRATSTPARARSPDPSQQVWIDPRSPSDLTAYVSLGSLLDVGTDDFTLTHWYRTTFRRPRRLGDVLGNRQDPSHGNFFSVRMHGEGILSVELDQDEQGTNYVAIDTGAMRVNDGQWHHFAYARRGGELRLCVDGRPIASASTPSGEPTRLASGRDFRLGRSLPAGGTFTSLPGAYALVRLVGRALSDGEVRADYVAGAKSMPPGTAAMDPDSRALPRTYTRSCAACQFDEAGQTLSCARCLDSQGVEHSMSIDLRACAGNDGQPNLDVENREGVLRCGLCPTGGCTPAAENAPEGGYRESCAGCIYDGVRGVLMCAACKDRAGYVHATTLVVASSRAPVCNEDGALRFCAGN
jgi:hypothetical protein